MTGGWKRRPLGELLQLQNGFAFDSKKFGTNGTPLIRIRDLKGGAVTETCFEGEYDPRYLVKAGDLLIGMDGEFRCHEWRGPQALLNQRVCRLQDFSGDLLPRFVLYGINKYLKEIEDVTAFATVKHLSSKQVLGIDFPAPPIEEQHRIVAILDEAFAGIATAKVNAEKSLQNSAELISCMTRQALESRDNSWVETELGVVCELYQPQTISSKDLIANGRYRVFGANGPIGWYDRYNHEDPQLLITCRGATCGTVNRSEAKSWITGNSMVVKPRPDVTLDIDFLEFLLRNVDISITITGAAQPQITRTNLAPLPISYPLSLELQKRLADKAIELKVEKERLESFYTSKLIALDELKQSLLQQAFTGQL